MSDKLPNGLQVSVSLPELISRRVKLIRSGKHWKGCCPFHLEVTPSFYVYDEGYHCFGCGEHGNAIDFVMKTTSLGLDEALQMLGRSSGTDRMVCGSEPSKDRNILNKAFEKAKDALMESRPMLLNQTSFSTKVLEALLATASRLLVRSEKIEAAAILANAAGRLEHWNHDNWNGGQDTWRLYLSIPADVYFDLEAREDLEKDINAVLLTAMKAVSSSDAIEVEIITSLDHDPDWREKVNCQISGQGITNQGRVRSDNIAARTFDGLLFRSKQEVYFYQALKSSGMAFAPLSVVLHGGVTYNRVEPDFIVYKDGMTMIVEIDGDLFHSETPAAAHTRLKFLMDEGAKLERIIASDCDTPAKAKEAVERVAATLRKHHRSK